MVIRVLRTCYIIVIIMLVVGMHNATKPLHPDYRVVYVITGTLTNSYIVADNTVREKYFRF